MQKFNKKKKKKSTAFSIAQDYITCQIIAHCPGQHDEKLYPMPARQQKYIHFTVAQAISESSELASLHNWRPIFKRRPHFVYLTLHCAVRHAYVVPAIHQNHKGLSCCFPAENNVLNFKSFCTHKQPCLWAQCSKQVCSPAQNCMWTNLGWSSSKNLVWNVLTLF